MILRSYGPGSIKSHLEDRYRLQAGQTGFETADYGTAQNLFTNGQAAMFYMGSWEMSMANNPDIPADIRDNIRVFTMPTVSGGKGTPTTISAWNGGGYAVSANGAQRDEAIKLLNFMFKPENWTKVAWENGVCCQRQLEIVRKRRRNFVVFRRGG